MKIRNWNDEEYPAITDKREGVVRRSSVPEKILSTLSGFFRSCR